MKNIQTNIVPLLLYFHWFLYSHHCTQLLNKFLTFQKITMNNNIMKATSFGKFLILLAVITIILFSIQYFIITNYLSAVAFYFKTWQIYLFHFVTVAALIFFLLHRSKIKPESIFNTFVVLSGLKMLSVIVFLSPLLFSEVASSKQTVIAFFIPYFIYLFFELWFSLQLLNGKKTM